MKAKENKYEWNISIISNICNTNNSFLLIINLLDIIERQIEKEIKENIKILDKRMKKIEKMRKKLLEMKGKIL